MADSAKTGRADKKRIDRLVRIQRKILGDYEVFLNAALPHFDVDAWVKIQRPLVSAYTQFLDEANKQIDVKFLLTGWMQNYVKLLDALVVDAGKVMTVFLEDDEENGGKEKKPEEEGKK